MINHRSMISTCCGGGTGQICRHKLESFSVSTILFAISVMQGASNLSPSLIDQPSDCRALQCVLCQVYFCNLLHFKGHHGPSKQVPSFTSICCQALAAKERLCAAHPPAKTKIQPQKIANEMKSSKLFVINRAPGVPAQKSRKTAQAACKSSPRPGTFRGERPDSPAKQKGNYTALVRVPRANPV